MNRRALFLFLLLSSTTLARDARFNSASNHFYNLEYDKAVTDLQSLTASQPDSAEAWNDLAQGLFYSAMFDSGVMGSDLIKNNDTLLHSRKIPITAQRATAIQSAVSRATWLAQSCLRSDPKNPAALYQLGLSDALRAEYAFIVKHSWISGARDANQSRKLHEQVISLDPAFADARLIPALHEYMIGTLPRIVAFAARTAGFKGDREQGLRTIEDVARHGQTNNVDAEILLGVLYRREKRPREALTINRKLSERYPRNFLFRIELAKVYADMGDQKSARAEVSEIQALINHKAPGYDGTRVPIIRKELAAL